MTRKALGVVLVAVLVVLAGCAGGTGGAGSPTGGDGAQAGDGTGTNGNGDTGFVSFYVSDEPNAIDDFRHLNVTITRVGLHRVGGEASPTPANATATPTNATATPASATPVNETATGTPTPTAEGEQDGGGTEGDGGGKWVEYEVNATVDLTRLVGANATKLDVLKAPAGTYDKVFVYVSEINATLKNGKSVNVKLPSQKLHINKRFEVGDGSNVSFVFDIAVHKAGKSGKYILKPVVSQSGTDVEVDEVGDGKGKKGENGKDEKGKDEEQDGGDDDAAKLEAEFVGKVAPGENVTVKVTGASGPVANATVEVNGEVVGTTGSDGTLAFRIPADAKKVKVKVKKGDAQATLTRKFEGGGEGNGNGGD